MPKTLTPKVEVRLVCPSCDEHVQAAIMKPDQNECKGDVSILPCHFCGEKLKAPKYLFRRESVADQPVNG